MNAENNPIIHFEKVGAQHQKVIFEWLAEPHMQEFWDNSQEHKDDILNFIHGRKQHYFYGTTCYWIGSVDQHPFCFLLTDEILPSEVTERPLHKKHLSNTGRTICIDFGIGNKNFLGKGLAAPALKQFVDFYQKQVDPQADTFFIDPDDANPRAKHVYEKAGFSAVGEFLMQDGAFKAQKTHLMIKKLPYQTPRE